MIVAITGANGFIGQHLVRHFQTLGWKVRPLVRRDLEAAALEPLFDGTDVVIHTAGATRAPTIAVLRQSNVALTARIVAAASKARFVFVSSQAAAGPARTLEAPVTESMTAAPVEAYGRSKRDAERVVQGNAQRFVILRPAAVYGPGDRDFLAMFRLAHFGVAIHPGNREHWLSIVHVDDLVRAIEHAATVPRAVGGTFFIANETPVQWQQLFRTAAECAGRRLAIDVDIPMRLVRLGAAIGDVAGRITGRAGLLTSQKAALAAPRHWTCSVARATRELGFHPQVELLDGLRGTYHWYRAQHWL